MTASPQNMNRQDRDDSSVNLKSKPQRPDSLSTPPHKNSFREMLAVGALRTLFSLVAKLLGSTPTRSLSPQSRSRPAHAPLQPSCAECLQKAARGVKGGRILKTEPLSHEQIGVMLVLLAFLIGIAGGIAFLYFYWTRGSNLLLGSSLACFWGGFGLALVFWSHLLTITHEIVEPREPVASTPVQREETKDDFLQGAGQIQRRGLLKLALAGGVGIFGAIVVSLFRSLGSSPERSLYTSVWKAGQRLVDLEGKAMTVDALLTGSTAIVFPEDQVGSERAQTVLIRVDEAKLQLPTNRSDWAPKGNLAYSRVCTHAGCPVGMYETTTNLLMCPCHQSTFDVLRAAEPTSGPAARALPQLPLYVDADGTLRAGGGFSDIPGPGFWSMP